MSRVTFSEKDIYYMQHAIELAKKGRFTTAPNPNVGCVIVLDDVIIGQGFHFKAGEGHAEVHALAQTRQQKTFASTTGATCYVTLEPCAHFGRTPPCAVALTNAGIKRVVIAMTDPNPKVAGRGIAILEQAGICVEVGLLAAQSLALNLGFVQRMQHNRARVSVKMASSLDGKTALENGQSQWITGPKARIDVQHYRALHSAILTGSGTVLCDDPSLNVRFSELEQAADFFHEITREQLRQPIRIILDSHNKLTLQEKLFTLAGKVILVSLQARDDLNAMASIAQVEQIIVADNGQGHIDLHALLTALNHYEINDLWVEAGATLAGEFFKLQLVDQFILYQAPKLMGAQARNLVNLDNYSSMQDVVQLTLSDVRLIGDDIRIISERN